MKRATLIMIGALLVFVQTAPAGTVEGDFGFYRPAPAEKDATAVADNVILLIGDGMGLNQVAAAQFAAVGPEGRLSMQTLPVTGLVETWSADRLITDSAASGTALATGRKTNNGMISTLPDSSEPPTIFEAAERAGMATGLVVTSTITHATPAVFAAHHPDRDEERAIALDIAVSGVDVLFGGGLGHWLPEPDGDREDGRDLIVELVERGYTAVNDRDMMFSLTELPVVGLFQDGPLTESDPGEPSIAEMTRTAIDLLSAHENGFFLMVEGSQIDWEGHGNDEDELARRLLLFDMAVAEAVAFARASGNTLVLVTADHETGGLTITAGERDGSELETDFSTGDHTAGLVPVYAGGPGAYEFSGVFDNTMIPVKIARLLGLSEFGMKTARSPAREQR